MIHRPWSIWINRILILANVLIWLVLGTIIAMNAHPALPVPPALKAIMAIMSFAMAGVLIVLYLLLMRGRRAAFYLMLAFFGITSLLTIFDDVGISDIVVLIMNFLPIIFLILDRKWYLREREPIQVNG